MHKNNPNRLIREKSPYLIQHAYNPVDWYPWSDEAFNTAKMENKPVFLSIGYSTCHWCHVMEKESFEDKEIAKLLNDSFISIKVDREERPDIDNIYMPVCQMLTGGGGWPLTIVMTYDQKPFFAGTYFSKYTRRNRIGLIELIPQLLDAWKNQKEKVYNSANEITKHLSSKIITRNNKVSEEILDKAYFSYKERFDQINGGFGDRPKFPSPHNFLFLLRYYNQKGEAYALEMVNKTLTEMRKGGIFDHIGFGFHRYSTDEKWFLPHFEKMLYDQAMLTIAYTEAYQVTKNDLFRKTVYQNIEYVLRDMTSDRGAFYSAEDADSEGEEGKCYLWNRDEIIELLGQDDASLFENLFGFEKFGNFYEEATGERNGSNLPYLKNNFEDFSKKYGYKESDFLKKLDEIREILFSARKARVHPYKDDKILTDWNGLMIAALSISGRILGERKFLTAAENCVKFICSELYNSNGELLHRYRNGDAAITAKLDDYAFLIWGLIELYEANFKVDYLNMAYDLTEKVIKEFWDDRDNTGFYFTSVKDEGLITRTMEFYDGAIPSGNSVMYLNLLKLGKILDNSEYMNIAEKLGMTIVALAENAPTGFSYFFSGLSFYFGPTKEIIIAGNKESEKTKKIFELINENFIPNSVILYIDESSYEDRIRISSYLKNFEFPKNDTLVYICENYSCALPTNDLNIIEKQLKE